MLDGFSWSIEYKRGRQRVQIPIHVSDEVCCCFVVRFALTLGVSGCCVCVCGCVGVWVCGWVGGWVGGCLCCVFFWV